MSTITRRSHRVPTNRGSHEVVIIQFAPMLAGQGFLGIVVPHDVVDVAVAAASLAALRTAMHEQTYQIGAGPVTGNVSRAGADAVGAGREVEQSLRHQAERSLI